MALPSAADEQRDSAVADRQYEAAIRVLITRTREKPRFELVFKENQGYGYWRNLLGVRRIGIGSAVASLVILILVLIGDVVFGFGLNVVDLFLGVAACASAAAFWVWAPNEDRVKQAADSYAERLLDAAAIVQ